MASVALTFAYTPLLKPIPLLKNFVVAMVIAAAIAAGGLAAGAGVAETLTPSVLTFFVIGERFSFFFMSVMLLFCGVYLFAFVVRGNLERSTEEVVSHQLCSAFVSFFGVRSTFLGSLLLVNVSSPCTLVVIAMPPVTTEGTWR